MPKRQRNCEKHSMFGHLLLNFGGGDRHTCNMEGGERAGAGPWWGRGEGALPPPPPIEIGKKDAAAEEILTLFTYVLLMKLGGNRYTVQAKWKSGRTDACP